MTETLLEVGWREILKNEFGQAYFLQLEQQLIEEEASGFTLYPGPQLYFNALNLCPYDKVKVIIIGQDPYHGPGQAHGLAFSVPNDVRIPPSLRNIFKEIQNDLGLDQPDSGNLTRWSTQGVLLLNCILSVRANEAASHRKLGWEKFTDHIIQTLSTNKHGLVFLLWGKFAHEKAALIDQSKHFVLKAAHPSPLSAYHGFFGCKHFSKTNEWLSLHKKTAILW